MAISAPVSRGTASNKTAGNSISVNPSASIAAGKHVFVVCVADNAGTTTVTEDANEAMVYDTQNNVYTREASARHAGTGAAAAGVTISVFKSVLETGLATTDSVTFRLSSSQTAKAIGIFETGAGAGNTLILKAIAATTGTSTTPSATLASLPIVETLFLGIVAIEAPTSDGFTQDADYTTLSNPGTTGGNAANNVNARVAYRIATLTGDTYNPTLGVSADWAEILLAYQEIALVTDTTIEDDYSITLSQGSVIGTSSTPSGHTRLGTDAQSLISVSADALRIASSTGNWKDTVLVYGPMARSPGRGMIVHLRTHGQFTEMWALGNHSRIPGTLYPADAFVFDSQTTAGSDVFCAVPYALVEPANETFDRQELWAAVAQGDNFIGSLLYIGSVSGARNLVTYPSVRAFLRSPYPSAYHGFMGLRSRWQHQMIGHLKIVSNAWSAWYAGALMADKLIGSGTPTTAETGQTYTASGGTMSKTSQGVQNNGTTSTITANAGAAHTRIGARILTGASVSPVVLRWRRNSAGTNHYELLLDSGLVQIYKDGVLDSQSGAFGLDANEEHHVWIMHTGSGSSAQLAVMLFKRRAMTYDRIFNLTGATYGDYSTNTYVGLTIFGTAGNIRVSHWEVHE